MHPVKFFQERGNFKGAIPNERPDLQDLKIGQLSNLSPNITLNINGIKSEYNELMKLDGHRWPDVICVAVWIGLFYITVTATE